MAVLCHLGFAELTLTERIHRALPYSHLEFTPPEWLDWGKPVTFSLNGDTWVWKHGGSDARAKYGIVVAGALAGLPGNLQSILSQDLSSAITCVRPEPRRNSWQQTCFPPEDSGRRRRSILRSALVHFPKGK